MVVSGSPKRWYIPLIYHLYSLPSEGLYNPYHRLGEPETTIEKLITLVSRQKIQRDCSTFFLLPSTLVKGHRPATKYFCYKIWETIVYTSIY